MPYLLAFLLTVISVVARADIPVVKTFGKIPFAAFREIDQSDVDVAEHFQKLDQLPWKPVSDRAFSPQPSARWLRFDFCVSPEMLQPLAVAIGLSFVKDATLYLVRDGRVLQRARYGFAVPVAGRLLPTAENIIPLAIREPGTYSIIVHSTGRFLQRYQLELRLEPERTLGFLELPKKVALNAVLVGIQTVLFLFILLLLVWRFHTQFAYAAAFIFGGLWTILTREGVAFPLFGWSGTWLTQDSLMVSISLVFVGAVLYMWERLKPFNRWFNLYIVVTAALMLMQAIVSLIVDLNNFPGIMFLPYANVILAMDILVVYAAAQALRGNWHQRVFAIVWGMFAVLTTYGLVRSMLPTESLEPFHYQWGVGIILASVWIFVEYLWDVTREVLAQRDTEVSANSRIEMVNRLSHEIRTPLNAVVGLADLLYAKRDPSTTQSYAGMIHGAAQTLLGLVNDILDFARLGEREPDLAKQSFRLDKVLMEVMTTTFLPQVKETGIYPKIFIAPDIPHYLLGDSVRVKQIFSNLVSNAIKFSPAGGKIEVTIGRGKSRDGRVQLLCEVDDVGCGISEDALDDVFEPYVRTTASDNSRLKGTGLGLAITRMLVESMDGVIRVSSKEGEGTTFRFDLWLEPDSGAPNLKDVLSVLSGKRIALVSDLPTINPLLIQTLEYFGARVQRYPMLENALAETPPCDLLVTEAMVTLAEPQWDLIATASSTCPMVILDLEWRDWLKQLSSTRISVIRLPIPILSIVAALAAAVSGEDLMLPDDRPAQRRQLNQGHHILVVDDNTLNLMVCSKVLDSLHIPHRTAQGGKEALDAMQEELFSMVLLDCEMPDIDGFCVARTIRAMEADGGGQPTPIIALTAHTLADVHTRCMDAGMNEVAHKPVSCEKLAAVIERYPVMVSEHS